MWIESFFLICHSSVCLHLIDQLIKRYNVYRLNEIPYLQLSIWFELVKISAHIRMREWIKSTSGNGGGDNDNIKVFFPIKNSSVSCTVTYEWDEMKVNVNQSKKSLSQLHWSDSLAQTKNVWLYTQHNQKKWTMFTYFEWVEKRTINNSQHVIGQACAQNNGSLDVDEKKKKRKKKLYARLNRCKQNISLTLRRSKRVRARDQQTQERTKKNSPNESKRNKKRKSLDFWSK